MDGQLERVRASVSAEEWARRVAEADRQAAVIARVLERVGGGATQAAALAEEAPGEHRTTWVARLRRYRANGRDGLISRIVSVKGKNGRITADVVTLVQGIVAGLGEDYTSEDVKQRLERVTGATWSVATVRRAMVRGGVARPEGRPPGRASRPQPHPLAGAELLLAVDEEVGATAKLAEALHASLQALPAPDGPVRDDRANRDENGRFLPEYNAKPPRTQPELGGKFDSVGLHRKGKDLQAMRVAKSSVEVLRRKVLAVTMLPAVTDSPRWEALRHWQGDHLGPLVGIPYKPATIDKFLRELKYADVANDVQHAMAEFWLGQPELVEGPLKGWVLAFVDTATKSVWTHHFTRCVRVSSRGRVMPGISTVYLNIGPGTPVLYQSYSGHASLPAEVPNLLKSYEAVAGEETVRRLVVCDREGHSVSFLKALAAAGWQFIVPLRKSVTGPSAAFSDHTPWVPYQDAGDEVRGGKLLLNDSNDRENPLPVRVVERRRHRSVKKVEHYATSADPEELPDAAVLDTYFERWPGQEHRFRDGNGRVHLDSHHGYGKLKVDNVAVLDRLDKLAGHVRRLDAELARIDEGEEETRRELEMLRQALSTAGPQIEEDRRKLDQAMAEGHPMNAGLRKLYRSAKNWEPWLENARHKAQLAERRLAEAERKRATAQDTRARKLADRERLEAKTQIFTVDVALDQACTALKLVFMNLAAMFMTRYLPGPRLQLDTLIRGVLTLPGERSRTSSVETIRIYRHDRDAALMARVGEACERLTAKRLVRGKRRLVFELVDPPRRAGTARGVPADTA